jgi:bifunctional oligoribonuclease and PAP phosphatase NrnA
MKILSKEEIVLARELVLKAGQVVITSHKSPDGDAAGSALAVRRLLHNLGIQNTVILPDRLSADLHWLPDYDSILFFDRDNEKSKELIATADLVFSLDYNKLSRVGKDMEAALKSSKANFILIDHHQDPESFAKVIYSDTSSCSTCEMVYHFIQQCDWLAQLDVALSECIYCGIMTDSGSFRFPSVSATTHRIVADLMDLGLDHAKVHQQVYDNNLVGKLKLVGFAINEKMEILQDCSTAIISLTKEELTRFNYHPGDTEGLVNQALSIQGIKLAAFVREDNSAVKVSFRSKGKFDVNAFARQGWNGGGHMNAAGGSTQESVGEALVRLRSEVNQMKDQINLS